MFCTRCGNPIPDNATACPVCGAQPEAPQSAPMPDYQYQSTPTPDYQYQSAPEAAAPQQPYAQVPPRTPPQPPVQPAYYVPVNPMSDEQFFQTHPQYRPLSAWAYFGYSLLFAIPLVGFICLIIFSVSNDNINRRNYARSFWCWFVLAVIIGVIIGIIVATLGARFYYRLF